MQGKPQIAIVDPNTLTVLGLKNILQEVMPIARTDTFGSFAELEANGAEQYFHYFVSMDILLHNLHFFTSRRNKTIVLTLSLEASQLNGFHCLCINVPEARLIKALLTLEQSAHANGRNLPKMEADDSNGHFMHRCDGFAQQTEEQSDCSCGRKPLTDRETEVMALIVQGYINKEIADRLNISLATVVTHRKNIMDKLCMKSVSALTIYAVMHGYVDINKI